MLIALCPSGFPLRLFWQNRCPSSYKMDHLQAVAVRDPGLLPLPMRDDREIAFYGHPVEGQLQPIEERLEREVLRHLPRFTIEDDANQPKGFSFSKVHAGAVILQRFGMVASSHGVPGEKALDTLISTPGY